MLSVFDCGMRKLKPVISLQNPEQSVKSAHHVAYRSIHEMATLTVAGTHLMSRAHKRRRCYLLHGRFCN